ncbi:substrate-binding domain-containing protein [Pseudonocardia alni]|uniref:substrate-binding domain-containing protein n=1 Tax=Pseudonocardia alni TaxID=33907 RepID=UPI0033D51612
MREVAAAAGVSQAAVSYAFNRPDRISAARRDHILATATRIGYAGPDPAGRNLRLGRVGAIGLMITDALRYAFDDPATTQLLRGISEVGEVAEVALTLFPCPREAGGDGSGLLSRGTVDGFLAYAMPDGHPGTEAARRRGLPMVVIDGPAVEGTPRVGIRDREAAAEVAAMITGLGHRRIGVLVDRLVPDGHGGPVDDRRVATARDLVMRERLAGYRDGLERAGIAWRSVTVIEAGGFDLRSSEVASETLLMSAEVTAVLAATDVLALAALTVAARHGRTVPVDLSVTGFDDVPAAAVAGLSTVRQPLVDKGGVATRVLLDLIGGRDAPASTLLPHTLVERGSTAPSRDADRPRRRGRRVTPPPDAAVTEATG